MIYDNLVRGISFQSLCALIPNVLVKREKYFVLIVLIIGTSSRVF